MNDSSTPILGSPNASFTSNPLAQFIQALPEDAIAKMLKPDADAVKLMESNIMGMLGALPSQLFETNITTDRHSLGQLMAVAMAYGYFLRSAEQRMALENMFPQS